MYEHVREYRLRRLFCDVHNAQLSQMQLVHIDQLTGQSVAGQLLGARWVLNLDDL